MTEVKYSGILCAFEGEFLVRLLQLRRLPSGCKILHALSGLTSLTFLERSSELSSSFPGRSPRGSSVCYHGQGQDLSAGQRVVLCVSGWGRGPCLFWW